MAAIHSIVLQQEVELNQLKRSDKLERRLQRELKSLADMEIKFEGSYTVDDAHFVLSPKHPLLVKHAKVEVLKKQVNDEKGKVSELG